MAHFRQVAAGDMKLEGGVLWPGSPLEAGTIGHFGNKLSSTPWETGDVSPLWVSGRWIKATGGHAGQGGALSPADRDRRDSTPRLSLSPRVSQGRLQIQFFWCIY